MDTKSGEAKSSPAAAAAEVATPSSGEPAAAHEAPSKPSDPQPLASISNQKSFSLRMRKFNRDEEGNNKSFGSGTAHRKKFEKLNSRSGVDILDAYKAKYAKRLLSNSGAESNEHKENMIGQEKEKVMVVTRKMLQRNEGIDLTGEETPKRDSIVMSDDEIVVAAAESLAELPPPDSVELPVEIGVDDKQVLINPEETKDRIANLEMNMKIMRKKKIVFV